MRLNAKYRTRRASRFPARLLTWLVVVVAAALTGWLWWEHELSSPAPAPTQTGAPRQKKIAQTTPPRPLAPRSGPASPPLTSSSALISNSVPPMVLIPVPAPAPASAPASAPIPLPSLNPTSTPPWTAVSRPSSSNIPATNGIPRKERILEAQLALVRRGISPGSLDGVLGSQTRAALRTFQQSERLPVTGDLDATTRSRLDASEPFYQDYTVSTDDVARLRPLSKTWLAKSEQDRLDYETVLELVAEKAQSHPDLVRRLNPRIDWGSVTAGATVRLPRIEPPPVRGKAAFVRIQLSARTLEVFDERTNLLAHFPCSIAKKMEKRPVGELHVVTAAANPNYTFNPDVFPESEEARELARKLVLPPGPNNPVGTVWIGLDRPGYGIHGTPRPEEVGRTESHGCFRLANWNAEYLRRLVSVGTPVFVEP